MVDQYREATVSILFADLVSSTEMLDHEGSEHGVRRLQDEYAALSAAAARHHGHHLKWLGDGVLVAFSSAADAVRCAMEMHSASRANPGAPLALRVGLNVGEVEERGGEYFGLPVVVAQRICSQARGGQTLCSALFGQLLAGRKAFRFKPIGGLRLKGIAEPVAAAEVIVSEADPKAVLAHPPLVGRSLELARLRAHLDAVVEASGRTVLIQGEQGVGKTRLVEEFATIAEEAHARVLWGRCSRRLADDSDAPFQEILRNYFEDCDDAEAGLVLGDDAAVIARLVPQLGMGPERTPGIERTAESERLRVLEAATRVFRRMSLREPIVLVVEDLQWSDPGTVEMLCHLARDLGDRKVLTVVTWSDAEGTAGRHLVDEIAELRATPNFDVVALANLERSEVQRLVDLVRDRLPEAEAAEAADRCGGNPLFIRELLLFLLERTEGRRAIPGAVDIHAGGSRPVPDTLKQMIESRGRRLSPNARALLNVASAFPTSFSMGVAFQASELSEAVSLDALDEISAAHLLVGTGSYDDYDFCQSIVRQVVYESMSPSRRFRIHARIAGALEARYADDAYRHAGELAHHLAAAGPLERSLARKAFDYSLAAARLAEDATGWGEAASHYVRCLGLLAAHSRPDPVERGELLAGVARCRLNAGEFREAREPLSEALDLFRRAGDAGRFAGAVLTADVPTTPRAELARLADEALAFPAGVGPHLEARLLAIRGAADPDERGLEAVLRAFELAERHGFHDVSALLSGIRQREALDALDLERAIAIRREAYEHLKETGPFNSAADALVSVLVCTALAGRLDDCIGVTREIIEICHRSGLVIQQAYVAVYRAAVALLRCDFGRFDFMAARPPWSSLFAVRLLRMSRCEMVGDFAGALAAAPAEAEAGDVEYWLPQIRAAVARVRYNAGDRQGAESALAAWAAAYASTPSVNNRAIVVAELDECLPALGDEPLVRQVYEEIRAWTPIRLGAASARGFDRIRGQLALRLGHHDEARECFERGIEWAEQERAPVEQARSLLGLAGVVGLEDPVGAKAATEAALDLLNQNGATTYVAGANSRSPAGRA